MTNYSAIRKVVSGGQTGVDRGALEAAIALGIPHGGWCPRGRFAEDGRVPPQYQLAECESSAYHVRTERNVVDSHATLVLHRGRLTAGTALTVRFARQHRRPHLLVDLQSPPNVERIRAWLQEQSIEILNVAGPRESSCPGIQAKAAELVRSVLAYRRAPE